MGRVSVYLPDDLAARAKKAGINISNLTQAAVRASLAARDPERWQAQVAQLDPTAIDHLAVLGALSAAKDDVEDD